MLPRYKIPYCKEMHFPLLQFIVSYCCDTEWRHSI